MFLYRLDGMRRADIVGATRSVGTDLGQLLPSLCHAPRGHSGILALQGETRLTRIPICLTSMPQGVMQPVRASNSRILSDMVATNGENTTV